MLCGASSVFVVIIDDGLTNMKYARVAMRCHSISMEIMMMMMMLNEKKMCSMWGQAAMKRMSVPTTPAAVAATVTTAAQIKDINDEL